MQKQVAGKLMGVLVCSWTHARKLEFKVLSSQWETFQIFVAARWPLRSVCTQKTPDEQTGETDEQPARRGDVSINTQRENLVWKHIIKLKLNEPELKTTDPVYSSSFLLSIWSPQHEDEALQVFAEPLHHNVSECLPASVFVGVGLVRSDSQHSVEQQHSWWARSKKKKRRRRAGLLQLSYCGTMIKHLTKWGFLFCFFSKYLVGPIQSDLHVPGAGSLWCQSSALWTCSPSWKWKGSDSTALISINSQISNTGNKQVWKLFIHRRRKKKLHEESHLYVFFPHQR